MPGLFLAPRCSCESAYFWRADERTRTADLRSLRVTIQALQGFAQVCKSRISKRFSLLWLAQCCTILRSRWYQSGIKLRSLQRLAVRLAHNLAGAHTLARETRPRREWKRMDTVENDMPKSRAALGSMPSQAAVGASEVQFCGQLKLKEAADRAGRSDQCCSFEM
jgi:hypothetical protein